MAVNNCPKIKPPGANRQWEIGNWRLFFRELLILVSSYMERHFAPERAIGNRQLANHWFGSVLY